jgi:hypothetical protein
MRFFEFKKLNKAVLESTRGIKGAVDDVNDKGMESPFSTKQGGKFVPSNSWFFPLEVSQQQYVPIESDQGTDDDAEKNGSAVGPKMDTVAEQFQNELATAGVATADLKEVNKQPLGPFAAIVVEITTDSGTLHFVRYYKQKTSGYIKWEQTDFLRNIAPIGFDIIKTKAENSNKAHPNIRLFPNRLGVTNGPMSVDAVAEAIRTSTLYPDDVPAEERIKIADMIDNIDDVMPATKDYKGNYEVQIGEIAGPIALSQGSSIVTGSVKEAETNLLQVLEPGLTWGAMNTVDYPADETQKLIDSFLISAKGTKVGTIDNKPDQLKAANPKFFTEFAEYLTWMNIIKEKDKKHQIFKLANAVGIINETELEAVKGLVNDPQKWNDAEAIGAALPRHYNSYMNSDTYRPKDSSINNAKYKKLWHWTTVLAKATQNAMNTNPEQLNRFFKTVLESSNMIQIKSSFQMSSDDSGKFTKMTVIYPPVFEGQIKFDSGKEFYATMALPGSMSFGFGRLAK